MRFWQLTAAAWLAQWVEWTAGDGDAVVVAAAAKREAVPAPMIVLPSQTLSVFNLNPLFSAIVLVVRKG